VWCNAYSALAGLEEVYYTDSTYTTPIKQSTTAVFPSGGNLAEHLTAADKAVMKPDANGYRLPTEAEWEFAARGGGQAEDDWAYDYAGSDAIDGVAWYSGNATGSDDLGVHPVGTKMANRLNLFDMSGNVQELCWDWYLVTITASTPSDGPAVEGAYKAGAGPHRMARSGDYSKAAASILLTVRNHVLPSLVSSNLGFRVACNNQ
jgi:formylglycine-generating enzyme required for sulfatase activity